MRNSFSHVEPCIVDCDLLNYLDTPCPRLAWENPYRHHNLYYYDV